MQTRFLIKIHFFFKLKVFKSFRYSSTSCYMISTTTMDCTNLHCMDFTLYKQRIDNKTQDLYTYIFFIPKTYIYKLSHSVILNVIN